MNELLTVHAYQIRPLDMINEGEWVQRIRYCPSREQHLLAEQPPEIVLDVGTLHVETVMVDLGAEPISFRSPCWSNMHQVEFHKNDEVTVLRGVEPPPWPGAE